MLVAREAFMDILLLGSILLKGFVGAIPFLAPVLSVEYSSSNLLATLVKHRNYVTKHSKHSGLKTMMESGATLQLPPPLENSANFSLVKTAIASSEQTSLEAKSYSTLSPVFTDVLSVTTPSIKVALPLTGPTSARFAPNQTVSFRSSGWVAPETLTSPRLNESSNGDSLINVSIGGSP